MIIDVTDATFQSEVVERSATMPVVVDLWAPWCGPCKTLGPIIENVINAANAGAAEPRVALVKVNVDENPQVSAAFQVQSIPAVFALSGGQVVDTFLGAKPEAEVKEFIDRLLPSATDLEQAALLEAGDESSLLKVLENDAGHPVAIPLLAEIYVTEGRNQAALDLLARIPETDETRRIGALARTGLSDQSAKAEGIETRLAELIDQVKGNDEAKAEYLDLLAVLGPENPSTSEWRKKLSTQLF